MTKEQQLAQVLRRAAKMADTHRGCGMCLAIITTSFDLAMAHAGADAKGLIDEVYRSDSPMRCFSFWMGPFTPESQQHRVIALLMLADAVEQGDF